MSATIINVDQIDEALQRLANVTGAGGSVTVATDDIRNALASVVCHAAKDNDLPTTHRVRLTIDLHNITCVATDRFTAGMAIASVLESDTEETAKVDLLPGDVAKILGIFKVAKSTDTVEGQHLLRLDLAADHIVVTDCSGMIDGRALKIPRLPIENDEDALSVIPTLIQKMLDGYPAMVEDMITNGDYLARFKTAATTYHEPLAIEARTGWKALLISCGESFIGALNPLRVDDQHYAAQRREWAESWRHRLAKPAV